jgi:DNA-binding transcriptional LysR family regulator
MSSHESKRSRSSSVNLQSLEVFCEVVRLQSFSRGAASFGLSQSAASQLVAHLETELGCVLIERQQRPLAATPEGKIYYLGCQELLGRHRAIVDELRRYKEGVAGTVRVASIYSVGLHTLSQYIRKFMSRYRGSTVHLGYFHPMKVYSAVLNDEADLGVISYPRSSRQIAVVPWLEEEMAVACPTGHRLARRKSMRLEDLDGEKFVAFDPDLVIRREIEKALKSAAVSVEVVSEFDNIETIKQAIEISEAVSILPRPSFEREVERGTLVEVPLVGAGLVRPVGIIHKRRRVMSPTTRQFVDTLTGVDEASHGRAGSAKSSSA